MTGILDRLARAWHHHVLVDVDARPLAVLRIGVGLVVLAKLIERLPLAGSAYSDAGWLPLSVASQLMDPLHWSVFFAVDSPAGAAALIGLGIVAAVALVFGAWSRIAAAVTFVIFASLHVRNPHLLYLADAATRIALLTVVLGNSGAVWSIDAMRRRARGMTTSATTPVWPLRLLQYQVAMVYLVSGLAKLGGETWATGDATWYGLINPTFSRVLPWSMPVIVASAPLLRAATWVTLYWEALFPAMLLHRFTRRLALGFGVAFHLGTLVLLRVEWWPLIMPICYVAFVPGRSLRYVAARLVRRLRPRVFDARITIDVDPARPRDRARAALIKAADVLRVVTIAERPGTSRLTVVAPDGTRHVGAGAMRAIGAVVPLATPLGLLARLLPTRTTPARVPRRDPSDTDA
jgi:hypothetical protein